MISCDMIHEMLYDDHRGLFVSIRDHLFEELNEEKMNSIIEFTRSVNTDLKSGKADPRAIVMIIDLLSVIHNIDGAPDNRRYMDEFFDQYNDFFNEVSYELIKGIHSNRISISEQHLEVDAWME